MRKFASLFVTAILCSALVFAQGRSISGVITDATGKPVPFASVTVKGTNTGANADSDGKFILRNVPSGATLVISSVGFDTKEVTIGTSDVVNVSITHTAGSMSEVVVTSAFGIKKSARVTPFSAQVISEEQLKIIPQQNINNALAGKVVGTQFRGQSPIKLNNQGGFRVRGGQTLADNGPIYVVDGTIVGSFDINPDDVEDVTFLKGVNATTLFGGRAANGAVVITTRKRGMANTLGIEVSTGVTVDKVYVLPKYQNIYAGGADKDLTLYTWQPGEPVEWQALSGKYHHEYTDDASWGPRMVGQEYIPWYAWTPGHSRSLQTASLVPQKDNARDFWETGVSSFSNISFAKAGQGFTTRISYTNNTVTGLMPNTSSEKHTAFGTVGLDLNQHFRAGLNISVVNQKIKGQFDDDYANQSQGSFNQWFHRDLDMNLMKELRNIQTPIGTYPSWNLRNNPGGTVNNVWIGNYWYNFFTWFENIDYRQVRDRVFGDLSLQYKLNNNFSLKATLRKSLLNLSFENIIPSILEKSASQTGVFATYATGQRRIDETNYEVLASFNKKFIEKLDVSANAGANYFRMKDTRVEMSTRNGLNVPDLYAITNSKDDPVLANDRFKEEQRSVFATGDFEWNRMVSATWAVRNDWYSTLTKGQNSILSSSFGVGFIFSEFTKTSISWLSFGKVFGSWGKKPTALGIYENNFLYSVNQNQWNGNFLMATPNTLVDPSTQGALITTTEVGVDLRFMKNRLGLNVVYYWEDNDKAPVAVDIYGGSGFTRKVLNAAQIKREGIEVIVTGRPVVSQDFNWDLTATFGYLIKNPVVSIADGVPRYTLAQSAFTTRVPQVFLEAGEEWGQLIGGAIKKNEQGLPMLNPSSGLYAREDNFHFGSVVPKTSGGLINTLTYKNIVLNLSLDYQIGGKFFSLSEMWGHYSGLMEATADVNDKGMNVRDDIADGGGVHVIGVDVADGKTPVDLYVDAQTYWHQFYNNLYDPFIHDLTYVKLREVSLGYQVPVSKMKIGKVVKGATVSVVARNPWLIYRDSKSFDPSEISEIQGEDGQYPGTRSLGVNLKLNF
jgi:TonB-linked SusC/RagA family outer membrane protein